MEWLEPPAVRLSVWAPVSGRYNELELPEGDGLLLLTDGLFEGHSGVGNERLGEDGLLELARSVAALPGRAFVDALIDERRRAHERTAGSPTTSRSSAWSGRHDDRSPGRAPSHRAGVAEPGAGYHGGVGACRSGAGAVLLNRTDEVSRQLIDHIQPARVAAYQLQAALRDQETALRGYAIAADRQFLDPYFDGQRAERSAADEIRSHVGYRADAIDTWTRSNEQLPAGGRRTPIRLSPP